MADTKISGLPAVTSPVLTDEFGVNQGGTSKKETLEQIRMAARPAELDVSGISVATEEYLEQWRTLKVTGTAQLAIAGTGAVWVTDGATTTVETAPVVGSPKGGSFIILDGWFLDLLFTLNLAGESKVDLRGSADLILSDDFGTRSSIVLAGRG